MPLTKSRGNMYPWVTHTHAHLAGECPHRCSYCYVNNPRFGRPAKYSGQLRLIEAEFSVQYGHGRVIFVEHCNDLFAEVVPAAFIHRILEHCSRWPDNTFVFQTKNPGRFHELLPFLPPVCMIGITLESDRWHDVMTNAPLPADRAFAFATLPRAHTKFVTVEPILDFHPGGLLAMLAAILPAFVNIGADSKGHALAEPNAAKIHTLIAGLKRLGIPIREKHNLQRLTTP